MQPPHKLLLQRTALFFRSMSNIRDLSPIDPMDKHVLPSENSLSDGQIYVDKYIA
jgi:hypothetical protein